ncbi:hypothetical protein VNO78_20052 [Psophocarpus tetragonolobus]|uniref:Uncharacterized protein n=1 Tax=Psophocarpus tetragonolobus TaxID=3891 RepID=A0AAN9S9N0_PSOTE
MLFFFLGYAFAPSCCSTLFFSHLLFLSLKSQRSNCAFFTNLCYLIPGSSYFLALIVSGNFQFLGFMQLGVIELFLASRFFLDNLAF